jgi:tetratricopeptide (TPR) repeat protein
VPGQLSTLYKINDADPESSVPTPKQRIANPLEFGYYIQDTLVKAEAATKRNDMATAIKHYRALAAAIPAQAQGWSLLCEAYEKVYDRERALRACKYALDREGAALKDYRRYVSLMVGKPGDLTTEEQGALNAVVGHLDKQPEMAIPAAHLRCQSAVKTKDTAAMQACTAVLAKAAPQDPKTIVFQWSYAVMRGDKAEASRLLGMAQQAGVASDSIERMSRVAPTRWGSTRFVGVAALGAVAILLTFVFLLLPRRRLAAARRLAP